MGSRVAAGGLPVDLLAEWPAGGEPPRYIPSPSFQILQKPMIVHLASSQKDSSCPDVEAEVDVPATEKDRGGRELEADRAGRVATSFNVRILVQTSHICSTLRSMTHRLSICAFLAVAWW